MTKENNKFMLALLHLRSELVSQNYVELDIDGETHSNDVKVSI